MTSLALYSGVYVLRVMVLSPFLRSYCILPCSRYFFEPWSEITGPLYIGLWTEVRSKGPLITEKLVIDGPFSENIGSNILKKELLDEVILCLNYDGKFGLNNMNSYFQNANTAEAVSWREWKYKVGDPILFNDTERFSLIYNN